MGGCEYCFSALDASDVSRMKSLGFIESTGCGEMKSLVLSLCCSAMVTEYCDLFRKFHAVVLQKGVLIFIPALAGNGAARRALC